MTEVPAAPPEPLYVEPEETAEFEPPLNLIWVILKEAEASASESVCELEEVSITSPECSPEALKVLPESFVSLALALLATLKVEPANITPTSS